jgi:hypothetical protein
MNHDDLLRAGLVEYQKLATRPLEKRIEKLELAVNEARSIMQSMRAYMTPGFSVPVPEGAPERWRKAIDEWLISSQTRSA